MVRLLTTILLSGVLGITLGLCPVKEKTFFKDAQGLTYPNILSGTLNEMDGQKDNIIITIKGTNLVTRTNEEGYFIFQAIPERIITLEFRLLNKVIKYPLGPVGYNKTISLEGITILQGYVSVEDKNIQEISSVEEK